MKTSALCMLLFIQLAFSQKIFCQNVSINSTGNPADASAMLDVSSTTGGFLMPRLTSVQRDAISSPAVGLTLFNTTLVAYQVNTGTPSVPVWSTLTTATTTNAWSLGGNSVATVFKIGTITNFDFPFITNNTERMRLSAGGNLGIGAAVTDGANAEKLLVDAGTNSFNVISGRGDNAGYLQLNIKNINSGTSASSDVVATNDAGTEANGLNFVDMGINSSTYSVGAFNITGPSDAYLYTTGNDFAIGNATATKSLKFFTGGTVAGSERMRINGSGNVGIGVNTPTATLHLKAGSATANTAPLKFISGVLMTTAEAGAVEFLTDKYYGTIGTGAARKEFTLNNITLTAGRVPFATTLGRLTDLPAFTYTTNRLFPTYITLAAGTATAATAPLVFTAGVNLTAPTAGALEFDGTHYYGTVASTRYQLDQQAGTIYTGSNGITLVGNDFRNNLITGLAGGQTIIGGTAASNSLTLSSTSNATKGNIILGGSAYDEANNRLGLGNTAPTEKLDVTGNVRFSGALMPNNAAGTAGSYLTSNGAGAAPTWSTNLSGTNTGDVTLGTANGLSLTGQALSLGLASTSTTGALSATDWNTFNTKAGTASVWSLSGNAGTSASTNFLGTTDNQDMVFKANNVEKLRLINSTSQLQIGNADSGVIKSTKEFVLRQDGDQYGPSVFRLRNRNGENGAIFETIDAGAYLVDFIFRTGPVATPITSNIRFETRTGSSTKVTGNATEWQFGQPDNVYGGPTLVIGASGTGSNSSLLIGNFGIGNANPAQKLDVTGNVGFSGALMPGNLAGTAGSYLTSNGAGAAPTWSTNLSGTNTGDVTLGTANGLSLTGQALSLGLASTLTTGALSATDWNTFNTKASASGTWSTTGNTGTDPATNFIGTTDNKSFKIRTNNIQAFLADSLGNVAVGAAPTFSAPPEREKFLVDAGETTSINAISARGSINNYLQFNIQNLSAGANATTDIVATANNGSESGNYVDLGINGSNYSGGAIETGVANDGYLISAGNDFYMVNSSPNKSMLFLTGGTGVTNERMRILANGRVGMGVQDPNAPFVVKDTMEIRRIGSLSQLLFTNTSGTGDFRIGGDGGDLYWQGGGGRALQMGSFWTTILGGDRQGTGGAYPAFVNGVIGTGVLVQSQRAASVPLAIQSFLGAQSGNLTEWRNSSSTVLSAVNNVGNFGIGNASPTEKLDVTGNIRFSQALMPNNLPGAAGSVLTSSGAGVAPTWTSPSSTSWSITGNSAVPSATSFIGTTSSQSFKIKTNNIQGFLLDSLGSVGIGVNPLFSASPNREKFLVDAGSLVGSDFINVISGKGTINNYLQVNIQNRSNGAAASSDIVATNDLGTESSNYVDMGINSSAFAAGGITGGPNTAYLFATGNDFVIGNNTSSKPLRLYTTSTALGSAEALRIDSIGKVGIGTLAPTEKLDVTGNIRFSQALMPNNLSGAAGSVLTSSGAGVAPTWTSPSSTGWSITGNGAVPSGTSFIGTTYNQGFKIKTNNAQGFLLDSLGNVGIGLSPIFSGSPNREKLLVDAGTNATDAFINVISGKGSTNNYLQVNIQNRSSGAAASSDIVATNNLGTENTNYIDMGINSSGFAAGGVTGGPNTAYLFATGNDFVIGNNTSSKPLRFYTTSTASGSLEAMRIDSSGKVGIGTTNPLTKLHVVGTNPLSLNGVQLGNASTDSFLTIASGLVKKLPVSTFATPASSWSTTGNSGTNTSGNFIGTTDASDFLIKASNTQGIIVKAAGNVGIGAAPEFDEENPDQLLVDAGARTSNVISGHGNIDSYLQLNIQNKNEGRSSSSDIVATANNGTANTKYIDMGINGGGYLKEDPGPLALLNGANTAYLYATGADFYIGNSSINKDLVFFTNSTETKGGYGIIRARINDTSFLPGATNIYTLGSSTVLWKTLYATDGVIQTSDRRLKTNIFTLPYGLKEVLQLQPVKYNWKTTPDSNSKIGLIAQDVKRVVPEIVVGDESKENLGMNYAELVPVLINAIKEQQQQIEALKKDVQLLKDKTAP